MIPEHLYDHYKETVQLNNQAKKERDKYFAYSFVLIILMFLLMAEPSQTYNSIHSAVELTFKVDISYDINVVQTFSWILLYYFVTKYFQKCTYMERTYIYLSSLESELKITRESTSYNNNYPKFLSIVDVMFKWFFPSFFVLTSTIKIIQEWIYHSNLTCCVIDSLLSAVIIAMAIFQMQFYRYVEKNWYK